MLGEGPTYGINGKKFSINFTKAKRKFCLSLHYNDDNSYLLVDEKEVFKFKADNKNINFLTRFCSGSISDGFDANESREVSLKGDDYDFPVDFNAVDKSYMFNIYKYLMVKINVNCNVNIQAY